MQGKVFLCLVGLEKWSWRKFCCGNGVSCLIIACCTYNLPHLSSLRPFFAVRVVALRDPSALHLLEKSCLSGKFSGKSTDFRHCASCTLCSAVSCFVPPDSVYSSHPLSCPASSSFRTPSFLHTKKEPPPHRGKGSFKQLRLWSYYSLMGVTLT